MLDYQKKLKSAIKHFWAVRERQSKSQGTSSGKKDYGSRGAVTGGKQLDKIIEIFKEVVLENRLPDPAIHIKETTLPGFFRPTKEWDLLVVNKGELIASIEFKSHVGPSFGNNFNKDSGDK